MGNPYTNEGSSVVLNTALVGDYPFTAGPLYHYFAYPALEDMFDYFRSIDIGKYDEYTLVENDFVTSEWVHKIAGANFIYVCSHGAAGAYELRDQQGDGDPVAVWAKDDPNQDPPAPSHEKTIRDAMGTIATLNATGYPPYCATSVPPANFLFIDACVSFDARDDWKHALYPEWNRYTGTLLQYKNQFAAGWGVYISVTEGTHVATKVTEQLETGKTALIAATDATGALIFDHVKCSDNYNGSRRDLALTDMLSVGDGYAKVAGVYTGIFDQTLDWYR
jgi:hypothetical protein